MPLRDHFRPPLSEERDGESFLNALAVSLADDLNRRLPEGYFAEEHTHGGTGVEIDVAAFEEAGRPQADGGPVATLPAQAWAPPAPPRTIPAVFSDDFEVRVFSTRTGPTLVGA